MAKKVKIFIVIILNMLIAVLSKAQQKHIKHEAKAKTVRAERLNGLLYVLDTGSEDFLLPYIEQKLKNLRISQSGKKLFDTVANLNVLASSNKIKASIITNLFENRKIGSFAASSSFKGISEYKNYAGYINQYKSVLLIKLNRFQNLIEFQFTLYGDGGEDHSLKYKSSSSVFVNPEKGHYQADIIRTLEQVFVQTSTTLDFDMRSNITRIDTSVIDEKAGKYYVSSKDSLVFDPLVSDVGSEDDRIYFWKQAAGKPIQLGINKKQVLKNISPGEYSLTFSFTNGIISSREDLLRLNIYERPQIKADYGIKKYYYAGDNLLYIQHFLLPTYQMRLDSKLKVVTDKKDFKGGNLNLTYNILDHERKCILKNRDFSILDNEAFTVDGSLTSTKSDSENNRLGHLQSGSYLLAFQSHSSWMKSDSLFQELIVLQRTAVSFVTEGSYFPTNKSEQMNSALQLALGGNFKFSAQFSIDFLEMTNILNNPLSKYYTNILANYDGFDHGFGMGVGVLLGDSKSANQNTIFGIKLYRKILDYLNGDLRLGVSYYSDFRQQNILGFHVYRTFSLVKI